ncbi:hypothetical protein F0562_004739 [Nyssa sinensis]|uniref:Probable magnesium transporter n=1 Tax=Nyssa sinensis TaxID=561372 RepID=A0A5J5C2D7_9ASTE|nr:hypothetical protein F0562_004739 [Nyssa sinensis]
MVFPRRGFHACSIAINFGTNLLKLGHDERERHSVLGSDGTNGKIVTKPIIYFQAWRVGILFFAFGNCLNFISFGYAAQSLLAALGSVQFVSNIAFSYFVLNKTVTVRVLVATAFIVLGNIFLVAFGNHQSPVYTPEQLAEKYSNITFLLYCVILILIVSLHHSIYRRGELLLAVPGHDFKPYWHMLLPFSYAIVSGPSEPHIAPVQFHSHVGSVLGLKISETTLVFDALRTTMFILGMISVFIGISLLAPDESKGGEVKDSSLISVTSSSPSTDVDRLLIPSEDPQIKDMRSLVRVMLMKASNMIVKAKTACSLSLGLGEDSIHASSVLVMPMVSSKITGFRGSGFDRAKFFSLRSHGWSRITVDEDGVKMLETTSMLTQEN